MEIIMTSALNPTLSPIPPPAQATPPEMLQPSSEMPVVATTAMIVSTPFALLGMVVFGSITPPGWALWAITLIGAIGMFAGMRNIAKSQALGIQ